MIDDQSDSSLWTLFDIAFLSLHVHLREISVSPKAWRLCALLFNWLKSTVLNIRHPSLPVRKWCLCRYCRVVPTHRLVCTSVANPVHVYCLAFLVVPSKRLVYTSTASHLPIYIQLNVIIIYQILTSKFPYDHGKWIFSWRLKIEISKFPVSTFPLLRRTTVKAVRHVFRDMEMENGRSDRTN